MKNLKRWKDVLVIGSGLLLSSQTVFAKAMLIATKNSELENRTELAAESSVHSELSSINMNVYERGAIDSDESVKFSASDITDPDGVVLYKKKFWPTTFDVIKLVPEEGFTTEIGGDFKISYLKNLSGETKDIRFQLNKDGGTWAIYQNGKQVKQINFIAGDTNISNYEITFE